MRSDEDTQKWFVRAIHGDWLAAARLISLHHARLRRMVARRLSPSLRGKIDPDDVLQEVYAEAVSRFPAFEYRGPDSMLAWLTRILESKLIDAHRVFFAAQRDARREVRSRAPLSDYASLAERVAIDSVTPSRIAARSERDALLMASLSALSPDQRQAVELRYLRGHPLKDVAELMHRTPEAVQMLCVRALRNLRDAIRRLSRLGA